MKRLLLQQCRTQEAMDKIRMQKIEYYIKNKELIKDKERDRYNANTETRERKK